MLLSLFQAAGWPIWPLLLCSVLAVTFIAERAWSLREPLVAPPGLVDQALEAWAARTPAEELLPALEQSSALGRWLAEALRTLQTHPQIDAQELRLALESSGRRAIHQLERFLPAIGTIAGIAPLLGLLGTVIGMIEIFASQSANTSNPVQLAQGISIALYNTAFGLIIAIPSLAAYRYLRARVDAFALQFEQAGERFMRHAALLARMAA